ncbi:outer membrane protein assembly factor BamA [Anaplasma platys]|uniref:Outer membrane protein assembly factor BamA n=2 Tax=Anaplasma platys TaxID=949 RepID=A0A858PZ62_9RICK|nr:outer membrane protein assembly factor BamA [Anaplasma platys]
MRHMRYFFVFMFWAGFCFNAVTGEAAPVTKIRVEGNERVDAGTVEFYAKTALPMEATEENIDAIIKQIHASTLFVTVDVTVEDDTLVISVKERPIVREVKVTGNSEFSNKDLENDLLRIRKLSVFSEGKLQRDIANLRALYHGRGFLNVHIDYMVKSAPQNTVDVIIKIKEGVAARIGNIRIVGNSAFSENVLRGILASRERVITDLMGYFSNRTRLHTERLLVDQSLLRDFYTSRGYLDFKVRSVVTELDPTKTRATIVFSVEEGKKYTFGKAFVDIDDNPAEKASVEKRLTGMLLMREGEVFNLALVEKTAALLTAYLKEKGNLFASVQNDFEVRDDVVDVKYKVVLGQSVYIRKVNIIGNTRTQDLVIRQKLTFSEGDIYSSFALHNTRRKLLNLDFFETVEMDTEKVTENTVDINIKVKERGTGSFDIGAGFAPASGLVGKISIKERNLLGTGKVVSFDLMRSMTGLSAALDLLTPNFLESDVSLGVGTFYNSHGAAGKKKLGGLYTQDSPFSSTNAGFSTRLTASVTDRVATSLQYYYKYHSVHNIGINASRYIKEQEGEHFDSSIGYGVIYSSLDSAYMPRSGVYARLNQSLSGIGGNLHYVKTEASSSHLYNVFKKIHPDLILKVKLTGGYVFAYKGQHVKIGQRFFIGSNEIRGFSSTGIGPRDSVTLEALGGKMYYSATAQFDFPVGLPENLGIRGSVFCDVASLYGLDYADTDGYKTSTLPRVSIGFGFSWRSPFGPIRVDFGFPLVMEKFDVRDTMRITTDTGI